MKSTNKFVLGLELFIKRIVDIIGAVVGIILLIPITILVVVGNVLTGDFGPLFYCHKRIGKNHKYFKLIKFRTMRTDSQEMLEKLLKEDKEFARQWEENRKVENDPRITKMGKFLRKTSLDEFPNFINVLFGQMSLVGPRAVIDGEIEKFGKEKDKILSVRPGVTGNWAANGRSATDYDERVKLEAEYVDKFSLWLDIKILFMTVIRVIRGSGAM